ncbi:putative ankyrin repeat-containing domain-containing protein [Lupinus albus]|uniref:Putative ankyrin repeat-containing domain-containing protein n=1 Tax=Lupinus albus TaxID=3870 RepID=A0A6A4PX06_LUPAL|nr:putative ankyrin repeat-containing domain-containing protein [Lupinus albus]
MAGDGVDEIVYRRMDNINNNVPDYLAEYTFEGRWEKVIEIYNDSPEVHTAMISKHEGTALHMAVDLYEEQVIAKLVDAIIRHGTVYKALTKANEVGDTPLHVAASRGFAKLCKCIIGGNNERIDLMSEKNNLME